MINIPNKFLIAGNEIKVIVSDQNVGSTFGYFDSVKNEITIYTVAVTESEIVELKDEQIMNTYFHELFHCFNFFWNTETNEDLAQVFSNFMCEYERTKTFTN